MGENQKIYVIDDDKNICEIVSLYLEKEGFEVEQIYDGQTALKRLKKDFQGSLYLI